MPLDKTDRDTSLTLMQRIQSNPTDRRAWEDFVEHYQPMIRAWCLKWGSQLSDADDVTQEVLLKLLRAMRSFHYDPSKSFRGWLRTVTQSAWSDFVTARRDRAAGDVGRDADPFAAIADSRDALADLERRMEDAFDRELLGLAMRRVEPRVKPVTWRAFQLTALQSRTGAEAAVELGMPVAHVFVARHRVQKLLEEEIRLLRGREP
jgi:RNA polymerase sigma-70 factor (ECF subfamily)